MAEDERRGEKAGHRDAGVHYTHPLILAPDVDASLRLRGSLPDSMPYRLLISLRSFVLTAMGSPGTQVGTEAGG